VRGEGGKGVREGGSLQTYGCPYVPNLRIDLRMSFLVPTLDNADPLFAQVITYGFYLHHVEVADDQDLPSCSLLICKHSTKYFYLFLAIFTYVFATEIN